MRRFLVASYYPLDAYKRVVVNVTLVTGQVAKFPVPLTMPTPAPPAMPGRAQTCMPAHHLGPVL